jgi:PIN domain nuclease of toxin-antitoxin system
VNLRLLLDSHIFLWALMGDARLTARTRQAILDADDVYISAASVWELAIKAASGKLRMPKDIVEKARQSGYIPLPVTAVHAVAAAELPLHHRDPFDRMLVAQASLESLTLLTADPRLKLYSVGIMLA